MRTPPSAFTSSKTRVPSWSCEAPPWPNLRVTRLFDRRRRAQVKSLGVIDAQLGHQGERALVVHPLAHRLAPQRPCHPDDRADDLAIDPARCQTTDEVAVDLDVVDRQVLEIEERPEAGPE